MRTGQPLRRQDAFANCGGALFLSHAGDELVLTANCCRDRLCQPCQAARRARLVEAICARMHDVEGRTRFLTLTLKARPVPLADQLDRLLHCFRILRGRPWWKQRVRGGAFFVEVKLGEKSGAWHPHLHILCEGGFIDQRELSTEWFKVTGDSFIVDVRQVTDPVHRARYVTKYATKPASADVIRDPARLDEFVAAIKGRRLYQPFGLWRALDLDPIDDAGRTLTYIGSVESLIRQAHDGSADARRWLEAALRKWPSLAAVVPPDTFTAHAVDPP